MIFLDLSNVEVSIVIPVRNESKYIERCIKSIVSQDYPKDKTEIIFVDGDSEDNTVEIIKKCMTEYEYMNLLDNPDKFVQRALNIGMKAAKGKYIVRMDAHSQYATDYVSKCIEYLEKTDASNVGGPMNAYSEMEENSICPPVTQDLDKQKANLQLVIAAAYHSKFALGGGKNHDSNYEGLTDTVFLGAFRKSDIEKLGYYDERLVRNEDDDLSFRMIENGMKIFITPKIKSVYYPRNKYSLLFKQYFEYGLWKVAVIKKHRRPARISHLIPLLFVLFILFFGVGSFFSKFIFYFFLSVMTIYFGLNFYCSLKNRRLSSFVNKLRLVLVHLLMHLSYGTGFLCGIFKFWNFK